MPPTSPEQMLEQLQAIFPAFDHEWDEDDWPGMERTFHSVVREFAYYFPSNVATFTERQIRALAAWINGAVLAGGQLENAISTCFLEHSKQLKVNKLLWPHLSATARKCAHA